MRRELVRRPAIIGSSGGAALRAAVRCLRLAGHDPQPLVIADRRCGMFDWARHEGFEAAIIPHEGVDHFSEAAAAWCARSGCADVLLFYTRRVSGPLVHRLRTMNIHPSLLPAFPGLHGVEDAFAAGAPELGATLHRVDDALDTGAIVAQAGCEMPHAIGEGALPRARFLSYLQKCWLTLVWFDLLMGDMGDAGYTGDAGDAPSTAPHRLPMAIPPAVAWSTRVPADEALVAAFASIARAEVACAS